MRLSRTATALPLVPALESVAWLLCFAIMSGYNLQRDDISRAPVALLGAQALLALGLLAASWREARRRHSNDEMYDNSMMASTKYYHLQQQNESGRPLFESVGAYAIVAGWLALSSVIGWRLVAAPYYGGWIPAWDFGPKADGGDNIPFAPEFNSFGHTIQGALVLLQFPCMATFVPQRHALAVVDFGSLFVFVYPVYNVVKRTAKSDNFALSSFCNNSMEWCFGFLLAFTLGRALESLIRASQQGQQCDVAAAATSTTTTAAAAAATTDISSTSILRPWIWYNRVIKCMRLFLGALIFLASLWAAILYAITWQDERPSAGAAQEGLYPQSSQLVVLALLAASPVLIALASLVLYAPLDRRLAKEVALQVENNGTLPPGTAPSRVTLSRQASVTHV